MYITFNGQTEINSNYYLSSVFYILLSKKESLSACYLGESDEDIGGEEFDEKYIGEFGAACHTNHVASDDEVDQQGQREETDDDEIAQAPSPVCKCDHIDATQDHSVLFLRWIKTDSQAHTDYLIG